jgi:hypothetical protein
MLQQERQALAQINSYGFLGFWHLPPLLLTPAIPIIPDENRLVIRH